MSVAPHPLDNLDPSVRQVLEPAYELASGCASFKPSHAQTLLQLLVELKSDTTLLCAALFVRPLRAQELALEEIEAVSSEAVVGVLQALEDLSLIDRLHEQEQSDLESLRKMLLAIASDIRAVILKLSLQALLMREVERFDPQTQQRLALQTQDLFAPLANRLGIAQLKLELEDNALRILEPDIYQEISQALEENRADRERYIERIIALLRRELQQADIRINRIYGRVKHINSIYLKMKRKRLRFEQVNDVRAVRVEVPTKGECYGVLSVVNALWQPIAEEFDDYIAQPKANGYQSLHTSLIGPDNRVLEVQIRTSDMHQRAELGVAAHWLYKEKGARHTKQFEQQIEWLRRILEGGDAARGDVVFNQFRNEAFRDRVYAVSPQGRVVDLPEGATPLDFAYHIHTQLGHRCIGAKLNQKIVPLTTALKNGDVVDILTQKEANPSRDWLNEHLGYLQSGRAKAKVRSYFKKLEREKSIAAGQEMLQKEAKRLDIQLKTEDLQALVKKFNVNTIDELLAAIGFGDVSVLMLVHELLARQPKPSESLDERLARIPIKAPRKQARQSVIVEGMDDLMINFASCCQPVPPAPISGFITLGRGVNVHRKSCTNVQHLAKMHPERMIEAHWSNAVGGVFSVDVALCAFDRAHLLRDITQIIANEKSTILKVDLQQDKQQQLHGQFTLEIADMSQLSRIIDRLSQLKDMKKVHRVSH